MGGDGSGGHTGGAGDGAGPRGEWLHAVLVRDAAAVDAIRRWHEQAQPGPLVLLPSVPGPRLAADGHPLKDDLRVDGPAATWVRALLAGHEVLEGGENGGRALRRANGAVFLAGPTAAGGGPLERRAELEARAAGRPQGAGGGSAGAASPVAGGCGAGRGPARRRPRTGRARRGGGRGSAPSVRGARRGDGRAGARHGDPHGAADPVGGPAQGAPPRARGPGERRPRGRGPGRGGGRARRPDGSGARGRAQGAGRPWRG